MKTAGLMDVNLRIISSKLVEHSEVVVCFFENCNLSCVFCPQNHDATVGMSKTEILSKVPLIIDFIAASPSKEFHLHLMGGELFQDHLIKNGFLLFYSEFMQEILKKTPEGKKVFFNFISNLILNDIEPLVQFCSTHNLKLSLSYDPAGRFNAANLELFKKNVERIAPYIRMVSCVITKASIQKVMKGDPYFEYLYNNFPIDWDPLLPSLDNSPLLMPRESELLQFNQFLIDRFPDCINLENFISTRPQSKMRCTRGKSLTIFANNYVPAGCSGEFYLKESKTEDLSSHEIIKNFVDKYGCLTCEFFSQCPFTCFIKQDYKRLIEDFDGCVYKETFKYARAKYSKELAGETL
jgi:sulfatase maturation enzyme AslB (radical SAM superfamily)